MRSRHEKKESVLVGRARGDLHGAEIAELHVAVGVGEGIVTLEAHRPAEGHVSRDLLAASEAVMPTPSQGHGFSHCDSLIFQQLEGSHGASSCRHIRS